MGGGIDKAIEIHGERGGSNYIQSERRQFSVQFSFAAQVGRPLVNRLIHHLISHFQYMS
jgi:hypothetical protein